MFPGGPDDIFQAIDGFGDLVALNEAGDVACSPAGHLDTNGIASTDGEFGTIVVPHGGDAQLVGYPGRDAGGFGSLSAPRSGPEGGYDAGAARPRRRRLGVLLSRISPGDRPGVLPGEAAVRTRSGCRSSRLGGSDPDPTPIGGVYSAASSGPATDAHRRHRVLHAARGRSTTEALIYRAASGAQPEVIVGDRVAEQAWRLHRRSARLGSPLINDSDQVVVFKSFVARGQSALGIFRWSPENPTISTRRRAPATRCRSTAIPRIVDLPGDPSLNAYGRRSPLRAIVDNGRASARGIFAIDAQGMRKVVDAGRSGADRRLPDALVRPPSPRTR